MTHREYNLLRKLVRVLNLLQAIQFLRAPQVHQAPIGVAKRPGGAFSGGNVQTNGKNIVNMAPPGPGVSTRGKLHVLSTLIILKLYQL